MFERTVFHATKSQLEIIVTVGGNLTYVNECIELCAEYQKTFS
jgi:hypothetical protein